LGDSVVVARSRDTGQAKGGVAAVGRTTPAIEPVAEHEGQPVPELAVARARPVAHRAVDTPTGPPRPSGPAPQPQASPPPAPPASVPVAAPESQTPSATPAPVAATPVAAVSGPQAPIGASLGEEGAGDVLYLCGGEYVLLFPSEGAGFDLLALDGEQVDLSAVVGLIEAGGECVPLAMGPPPEGESAGEASGAAREGVTLLPLESALP
jgi:hypothetical protein